MVDLCVDTKLLEYLREFHFDDLRSPHTTATVTFNIVMRSFILNTICHYFLVRIEILGSEEVGTLAVANAKRVF